MELFTTTPDKVNAFISTIFKIARNYQVDEAQFYLEALRSYQDMYNNHFPELEEAVAHFKRTYHINNTTPFTPDLLEDELKEIYGIEVSRNVLAKNPVLKNLRSYFDENNKVLHLQSKLSEAQENFLLARELGFQFLNLEERPYETTIIQISSFRKIIKQL